MAAIVPITGSSSISGAGYDPDTESMEIVFHNGRRYTYPDVPVHVYEGLMAADSPGSYFNSEIKGRYG